ncbi:MAG: hypothetical protein U1F76_07790 [Candidatus Competibacteraceae bacterium]
MTATDLNSNPVEVPTDLVFRAAWEDERLRALRLFPDVAGARGHCFVAVRQRPVERIVGAAFWQEVSGRDRRLTATFRWRVLPVLAGMAMERAFLLAFRDQVAEASRAALLRTADPLSEGPAVRLLQDLGFEPAYRHECFGGPLEKCIQRTRRTFARLDGKSRPAGVEIITPAPTHAEALVALVSERHGLLAAEDIRTTFIGPAGRGSFEPRFSALLYAGDRLTGVCLVRKSDRQIAIPVLVADKDGPLAGGLVCALLFDHCQHALADEDVRDVWFRTNPELSPAMLRMARRFGVRHLGSLIAYRFVFGAAGSLSDGSFSPTIQPTLETDT